MSRLYELAEDYNMLLNEAESLPSDSGDVFNEALNAIQGEIEDKAEGICCVLSEMKHDASKFKAEETRLASRRKAIENNISRLKDYLRDNMVKAGFAKIEVGFYRVSVGKPSKRVEVTDESALPERYVIVTTRPAKSELAKDLKAGAIIAGAELVDGLPILRIR